MATAPVALVYDPQMAEYRFPEGHPMRPERFTLSVALMRAWGLLDEGTSTDPAPGGVPRAIVLKPQEASDDDLLLAHDLAFVEAVKRASADPRDAEARFGIGSGDTPAFPEMHEAAALAVGGTMLALDAVLDDTAVRAFNPAGGLHHAHRGRAAGFCIYNDAAIAIEKATRDRPGLRVAYVDIDAHHGDGVEEAFLERPDVLTLSVHESGRYLYPGTGPADDIGRGGGRGFAINVPLPPGAGPDSYALVLDQIISPALRAFGPDVIVAQLGGDAHVADPLTHLANTVRGYTHVVAGLVAEAEEVCAGRLAALGGGGYEPFSVVPRLWACAMAELMHAEIPEDLLADWLDLSARAAGRSAAPVTRTFDEVPGGTEVYAPAAALLLTEKIIDQVRSASPLLASA